MVDKRVGSIKLSRLWRYWVLLLLCSFLPLWFTAPPVAMAGPTAPSADGELNLVGKYQLSIEYQGTRTPHDLELTGPASGNGGQPAGGPYTKRWHITGSEPPASGQDFHWVIVYDSGVGAVGTTMHMVGTIQSDGSLQGTWWDNDQGRRRDGSWNTTSGHASRSRTKSLAPPAVNPPTAQEIVGTWKGTMWMVSIDKDFGDAGPFQTSIEIKADGTVFNAFTVPSIYQYSNGKIFSDWQKGDTTENIWEPKKGPINCQNKLDGEIQNTSSGLSMVLHCEIRCYIHDRWIHGQFIDTYTVTKVSGENSVTVPQPKTNADTSNAPGLGDVGSVPGPANSTQGAVGLLLPALIGVLGGLLSAGFGGIPGGTVPQTPSEPLPPQPPPDSGNSPSGQPYKPATIYGTGTAADPFRDKSAVKVNEDGTITGYTESTDAPTIFGTGDSDNPYSDVHPPGAPSGADENGVENIPEGTDKKGEPAKPDEPVKSDETEKQEKISRIQSELDYHKKEALVWREKEANEKDPAAREEMRRKAISHEASASGYQDEIDGINRGDGIAHHTRTEEDANNRAIEDRQRNEMLAEQKEKAAAIHELNLVGKAALEKGMWNPEGPGDVYGKTQKLLDDIYAGKPIDENAVRQVRNIVGHRITGKTADESSLDNPENQDRLSDALKKAGFSTMEEVITGKDADGKTSLTALGARIIFGIATGGISEGTYIVGNMRYAERDSLDRGETYDQSLKAAVKTGAFEGLFVLAGHLVPAAGAKLFPNVAAGIGEMLEPVAKGVAAADSAVQKASTSLANRVSKIFNPLPESLTGTRAAVTKVLESGSSADLAKLYSQDGMKKLAELQKAGHLSAEEAKILNSRLSKLVNNNIDDAMKKSIDHFERNTGVRVESSALGDSGSSAKAGGNPKALTDFDKTSVTKFNNNDLKNYATKNAISVEQANRELQEQFSEKLTNNVDNHLRSSGFSRGVEDVDYKTYTGIGKRSGQSDAYPPGFTGMRQAVQGTGKSYERGVDGLVKSHKISGQAVVDQHGLNTLETTGNLPTNPTKFHAGEFRDFSAQQVKSVAKHSDVKSLAKAMGRQNDLAREMDNLATSPYSSHFNELASENLPVAPPRMDPNIVDVANKINRNPSDALKILTKNGYTEETFAKAVRKNVNYFDECLEG